LNTPFFIAKRLVTRESTEKGLSKPIVRIAAVGIALGMAVMIMAVGIVTGFQNEIREKVIGFGSHIQVTNFGNSERYNDPKLEIAQDFYPSLDTIKEVKSISLFAIKQGMVETPENIQGVFVKGVAPDYDWSFIQSHLTEGALLELSDTATSNQILISNYLARRLGLALGDQVTVYFPNARQGLSQRKFKLGGLFDTGLRDLDAQFVFVDIGILRKINQWGLEAQMRITECENGIISLEALGFGGDGEHRFSWSADSLRGAGPHKFTIHGDTTIYVVLRDRSNTLADTATFRVAFRQNGNSQCPQEDEYSITTTGGSGKYYTGGFDIRLARYKDLDKMEQFVYEHLNYDLRTTTITQRSPEIFNWLEMLDLNTIIIIVLMILISVINMTSALLILIMERTSMIGILKALGATTWMVQKIFLVQAAYIIAIGVTAGNAIGIGIALLQQKYGFMKLDPENYYVSEVPVMLTMEHIIWLNAGTLSVCLLLMLLPSLTINQIQPARAIRFD
jgi:lipoprotein-releasing system permease protein